MVIAIDFDGTCVTHEFPRIGVDIGAAPVLRRLVEEGHALILWTMRSDTERGPYLSHAKYWFELNGITLHAIGKNPTQLSWTTSNKAYANLYIDDAALGAPLTYDPKISKNPFINWVAVEKYLESAGILKNINHQLSIDKS